jgi:hypothetical protein
MRYRAKKQAAETQQVAEAGQAGDNAAGEPATGQGSGEVR